MTEPGDRVVHVLTTVAQGRPATAHLHGQRGSGKTWWLDHAATTARERGVRVLRTQGTAEEREEPFAAVSVLLEPVRDRLDDPAWSLLRDVIDGGHRGADAFEVKVAAFRLLCSLAAEQPTCLLIDDVHLVDAASAELLSFAFRRVEADALGCITAGVLALPPIRAEVARLAPLAADDLGRMLEARGVVAGAAKLCADAAQGNPGLALALVDGLSDEQRDGAAPIAVLPRPAGGLADELQRRLRGHGDGVCRALVVAAAEHGGDVAAIRGALEVLGEPPSGLDEAEATGALEIVGTRVVFSDPWTRAASYHLVAPASRRAAHRALAACFAEPGQAAERAWHLAAGADGRSDAVADALALLAEDTAHRGGPASAALTAERAAEFAATSSGRRQHLMTALGWWLDAADAAGVARVARHIDAADAESSSALAEAAAFLHGEPPMETSDTLPGRTAAGPLAAADETWSERRRRRRRLTLAGDSGDHRAVLRELDQRTIERGSGDDLLAAACALRHAGRIRDARDLLVRALAVFGGTGNAPGVAAHLADADLDLLHGRVDDATAVLRLLDDRIPHGWEDRAVLLRGRASLIGHPDTVASTVPDAFAPVGAGALLEIREGIRAGVLRGDRQALLAAVELADARSLPVEAGEARLWLAAASPAEERAEVVAMAQRTLQRCGVRGWDARLALLAQAEAGTSIRPRDPAIDALSQAELRVADAVAGGLTNREVAATLLISVKTVDFHLQQIYRKIGVRSRTELAVRMAGHGRTATGERR
jgi:DNA-binding CsgD family transcriptional regulator